VTKNTDNNTDIDTCRLPRKVVVREIPIESRAYLKISGLGQGDRIIELEERELVIGRGPECRIQLPASTVSRKHAQIFFRNEEYHIEDLGSANGTYVNGIKIVKCVLRNKDQIDIGEARMLFHEDQILQKA
jgi:pSer/pThr/pTyr-binding forkhead associated (FHA) protein